MNQIFDAVIIGSGAGGAPIAHLLAKAGKSVLILEKGPLFRPEYQSPNGRGDFKRDEVFADGPEKRVQLPGVSNNGAAYYSSHVEPDINDEPHIYRDQNGADKATIEGYTAQVVGGGTQLYGGVSFRFTPLDFKLQSFNQGRNDIQQDPNHDIQREARDWPISYADLEPYYTKTEELIGINGQSANQQKTFSRDVYQPPLAPNAISACAKRGMELLARNLQQKYHLATPIDPYRTPLAVITQDHAPSGRKVPVDTDTIKTSYVNRYGDPLGFKSSTWVSLLSPIKDLPNFEIRCNSVATRLTFANGRVDKVFYLDPSGMERWVQGKVVVVACSGIESIRLLKLSAQADAGFSGAINQNDLLGRYFLTHCFGGASAQLPAGARSDKSKALDADWATDCCSIEAFLRDNGLWAGGALYNNTSDEALPLSLFRTLGSQDLDTLWNGFMSNTDLRAQAVVDYLDNNFGRGLSVSFMANQVPQRDNRIELHPSIKDKWGRPVAYILKTWHSHDIHLMNTYANMAGEILRQGGAALYGPGFQIAGQGASYMAENGLARIANHILGGARFGTDRADSVLDPNCRAWDFDNLYVADGSFMPTSGSGNPTNTIEANSFRVADQLLKRL
jgi:choline dehydrogenase-like flavoprotein